MSRCVFSVSLRDLSVSVVKMSSQILTTEAQSFSQRHRVRQPLFALRAQAGKMPALPAMPTSQSLPQHLFHDSDLGTLATVNVRHKTE
jgi:hypothetical protein